MVDGNLFHSGIVLGKNELWYIEFIPYIVDDNEEILLRLINCSRVITILTRLGSLPWAQSRTQGAIILTV